MITEIDQSRQFIATEVYGRLGNNLFQIAAGLTWAKRFGVDYYACLMTPYSMQFVNTLFKNVNCVVGSKYDCVHVRVDPEFSNYFDLRRPDRSVILKGYLQSDKFMDRQLVIDTLAFPDSVKTTAHELYGDVSDCVSVNVRRGDYVKLRLLEKDCCFVLPTPQWYRECMDHFGEHRRCIITSDDIEWCKRNITGRNVIYSDRKEGLSDADAILTDLYLQSACKDHVLSASTFSWWGAYFCTAPDKTDIFPYPWFDNTPENKFKDIYPESVIKKTVTDRNGIR